MFKKKTKETLSDKISSLLNTQPLFFEEDEEGLTTADQIAVNSDNDASADDLEIPKFRKLNIEFLDAEDSKYAGKKSSREDQTKAFGSDSTDVESTDEQEQPSISGSEDEDSAVEDEEEGEDDVEEEEDDEAGDISQEKGGIENFSSKVFSDIEKGKSIRNQLTLWDNLLECRIKFQKCLLASNQLPQHNNFNTFKQQGGDKLQDVLTESKKNIKKLLNSLLQLQDAAIQTNEEIIKPNLKRKGSDDEITSDSENSEIDETKTTIIKTPAVKKMKLIEIAHEIDSRHVKLKDYRNSTIQKWNDKTRINQVSNKNFNAFEQSTLKQIEHVLLDKPRLIRRTQIKRSNYQILGETSEESPAKITKIDDALIDNKDEKSNNDLNTEIFDDDDFYHQLLRELLERKSNDVTDPLQLSRQWIQLQKLRSKMKKKVDTKASKGRKVRFVVHQKLVNFMSPLDYDSGNPTSRTELLSSIFGKMKS